MWNPYLGIHMLSFARFVLTAGLVVSALGSAQADSGPTDLWSLYLREHAAVLCGRALTEEQETELDEAQYLARLRSQLSLSEERFSIAAQRPSLSRRALRCAAAETSVRLNSRISKLVPIGRKRAS